MPYNDAAQNALGTIGTVIWSGQVLPQIWKSFREKSTEGLSHWLMLIWSFSSVFLGTYNIVLNINIPLIIQPQLFGLLATISWIQCLYYGHGLSKRLCALILFVCLGVFGGFQAGMVFVTKHALEAGNSRPIEFFGIFSGVLISVGLLPQLYEIYRLREVKGISMIFMCLDISGGIFSTLSLAFKEQFDPIAATTYLCVVFLDSCIVLAAIILNPRAKRRRQAVLHEPESMITTTCSQGNIVSATGGGQGSTSGLDAPLSGTRSPRPAPAQAPNGNARQQPLTQTLQMPPPADQPENGLASPGSNGQPPHGQHIIQPPFARDNAQAYIVDDTAPQAPAEERANFAPIGEEADLPQLVGVEAMEQRRSLPQHGCKPLISDLSPLELAVVKHAALLALARSLIKDAFDLDDILELVEVKKGGFWNKLFKGGNDKKVGGVFGVPLELLVERQGADSLLGASRTPLRVPSFIEDLISALKQKDMSVEGIFRKGGNIRRLKELSDAVNRDPESVDLTQESPVQLTALLKKFLRELPDPLMTYKLHRLLVVTQSQPNEADRKRLLHLVSLLLPKFHRNTMEVLFVFLKWMASFSHVDEETGSKMDLPNLATVLGPSILYSKSRDPARDESLSAIRVVTQLLEEQDEFWAVPDEFLALLEDQDYFSNSMELTSKDFLKKVDTYMRAKNGRGGMAGGLPVMNPSPIIGGSLPTRTPRPDGNRTSDALNGPGNMIATPSGSDNPVPADSVPSTAHLSPATAHKEEII